MVLAHIFPRPIAEALVLTDVHGLFTSYTTGIAILVLHGVSL
jgi:hypothetical protein